MQAVWESQTACSTDPLHLGAPAPAALVGDGAQSLDALIMLVHHTNNAWPVVQAQRGGLPGRSLEPAYSGPFLLLSELAVRHTHKDMVQVC